ncbi:MAG: PTS sugar transporter subunit IIA [Proteobacteria bacterium]|nr:PTS sugar transporter subunit IIA [Pseudomonadota bacterium]
MKIMDILVKDAVVLSLKAKDKNGILEEMSRSLAAAEPSVAADELLSVLIDREELQSTGIGEGVAIPHGKMAGLDRLMATFASSDDGVDFASIDGKPTQLYFMLVVPEHSGGQHLKALARISRFFRDPSFRGKLMDATSTEAIFRAIEEEDEKF